MSEENKDLGDKAENTFDSAKESAKEFGEKASEKFDDAREAAGDFADDAKETASEFVDDVKEAAKEFKEDAKETFSPENPDSGKTIAIIAHITIIGLIIAFIMHSSNKTEIGSFYLRQMIGICLLGLVLGIIPVVNLIAWIFPFILWIISLVGAFSGQEKKVFLVGDYFQDWFKGI